MHMVRHKDITPNCDIVRLITPLSKIQKTLVHEAIIKNPLSVSRIESDEIKRPHIRKKLNPRRPTRITLF